MNKSELRSLIREAVEEVVQEFAPLGVADEGTLNEKAPPGFPKKLQDKLLKQYKDDEDKAYGTMWKIFYAKEKGHKKINEMWTAWEDGEGADVEGGSAEQNADHDETDLNNPEEKREVELAKQIKTLADQLLNMHGVEGEEGADEKSEEGDKEVDVSDDTEEAPLKEKNK